MTQDDSANQAAFAKQYYDQYVTRQTDVNRDRTRQRVAEVVRLCGRQRGRLLSIGAGKLNEPLAFREAGFDVTMIDIASSLMEQARAEGLEAHVVDLEKDAIPGVYDVVCCMEVLEHLLDPLGALKKAASAVAPGGRLFVSLPDEFNLYARLAILLGRPPFSRHDWPHIRFFNLRSARELFAAAGLQIVNERHMPLVPPRWRWLAPLGTLLARCCPRTMSISHVFELRPNR